MGRRPKVDREGVLAAARAAFAERGFEATTLAAIAARLDVSPAALLRHAATKQELFAACMAPGAGDQPLPIDFLIDVDDAEDPRLVFRRIALAFVPFLERRLDEHIARFMRAKSGEGASLLPFEGQPRPTPPQRAFALLVDYFRRAVRAGTLRAADPEAAALAFLASLHSYIVLRRVVEVPEPPIALDRYLDSLLEIWSHGAIAGSAPRGTAR